MTNNMLWGLLLMMEILPVLYLVVGLALLRRPPKLGKGFLSYRNFVSKKDEAHWQFAQKCFGRLLTKTMPIVCQTITAHKLEAQFHDMRDAMKDDD